MSKNGKTNFEEEAKEEETMYTVDSKKTNFGNSLNKIKRNISSQSKTGSKSHETKGFSRQ